MLNQLFKTCLSEKNQWTFYRLTSFKFSGNTTVAQQLHKADSPMYYAHDSTL